MEQKLDIWKERTIRRKGELQRSPEHISLLNENEDRGLWLLLLNSA